MGTFCWSLNLRWFECVVLMERLYTGTQQIPLYLENFKKLYFFADFSQTFFNQMPGIGRWTKTLTDFPICLIIKLGNFFRVKCKLIQMGLWSLNEMIQTRWKWNKSMHIKFPCLWRIEGSCTFGRLFSDIFYQMLSIGRWRKTLPDFFQFA